MAGFTEHGGLYSIQWPGAVVEHTAQTGRGTLVQMVRHRGGQVTCYMDGVIQSSTFDEGRYHGALVGAAAYPMFRPRSVCVVGGGEGATVREVFARYPNVESVHMIEWDQDVIDLFRGRYRGEWRTGGVWEDPRLRLDVRDVREVTVDEPAYDLVVVDLFDAASVEADMSAAVTLYRRIASWVRPGGVWVAYCGTRDGLQTDAGVNQFRDSLVAALREGGDEWRTVPLQVWNTREVAEHIPSFFGHAVFLSGRLMGG